MYREISFNIIPVTKEVAYGPSIMIINKVIILINEENYLDIKVTAICDWWLDGKLQQDNVFYLDQVQFTLDNNINNNDGDIADAVLTHYGFTIQ